jgi:hypothetical protein
MKLASLCFLAMAALMTHPSPTHAAQFRAYNVIIDPHGQALAAYQIEITSDDPHARIVGVEGGDHAAFSKAPFYDPAALQSETIIIAAFSTDADAPLEDTRIATVHMMEPDDCDCRYSAKLVVAVDVDGTSIAADLRLAPAEGENT